jgi:hypothetical protein
MKDRNEVNFFEDRVGKRDTITSREIRPKNM